MPKRKRKNDDVLGQSRPWYSWPMSLLRGIWQAIAWSVRQVWRIASGTSRWTWRQTKRAGGWTLRQGWRGTVWMVKTPFQAAGWLLTRAWWLVDGRPPEFSDPREAEVYWRIRRRFRRRNRFITHAFVFTAIMGVLWVIWLLSTNPGPYSFQHLSAVTVGWGLMLAFHFMRLRMGEAEDQALEEALERERGYRLQEDVEPKRKRTPFLVEEEVEHVEPDWEAAAFRLGDDGEWLDIEDDPAEHARYDSQ